MRTSHQIFHQPNQVDLTFIDRPIHEAYTLFPSGAGLSDTMPMWRVQTEGYKDGKGMLVGTVAYNLDDSPDGEYISGGFNSKRSNAMAIGRQGSYLHWGFAASPTYMTDEAKLVFVNAVHYIHQFAGQRAFVTKKPVPDRGSIATRLYQLSEAGNAAWQAHTSKMAEADQNAKKDLLLRQEKGDELTRFEKARLKWDEPSWKRTDALKRLPKELREQLGENLDAYVEYFEENMPYFVCQPDGWFEPLTLDKDVKHLGIPNNEIRLLDHCIERLRQSPGDELALRILKRYTNQEFSEADQWKRWLTQRRKYLFFSELSGFKFIVDVNRIISDGNQSLLPSTGPAIDDSIIDEIMVDEPDADSPVTFKCALVPLDKTKPGSNERRFRVVVKFRIQHGWHLYSSVPADEPYIPTKIISRKAKRGRHGFRVGIHARPTIH